MKPDNLVRSNNNCSIEEVAKWIGSKEEFIDWTANQSSYPVIGKEFEKFYSSNEAHRLVLENSLGEVVAYGELCRINVEKRLFFLPGVIVDSRRRNQGVGKTMVNEMIEYADKLDVNKMDLYIFSDNIKLMQ